MFTKELASKILSKLVKIKGVLRVQLDIGGLLSASSDAHTLLHKIEGVASRIRWLYEKEKLEFRIWEASVWQATKEHLAKDYLAKFQSWDIMPRGHRPDKPQSEPKETEIRAIIRTSPEYRERSLSLLRAQYLCTLLEKAYVDPIRQRIMLIMSINKLNPPS